MLAGDCPAAAETLTNKRVMVCVNDSVVPDSYVIAPDQAIELLAPVSGG